MSEVKTSNLSAWHGLWTCTEHIMTYRYIFCTCSDKSAAMHTMMLPMLSDSDSIINVHASVQESMDMGTKHLM